MAGCLKEWWAGVPVAFAWVRGGREVDRTPTPRSGGRAHGLETRATRHGRVAHATSIRRDRPPVVGRLLGLFLHTAHGDGLDDVFVEEEENDEDGGGAD